MTTIWVNYIIISNDLSYMQFPLSFSSQELQALFTLASLLCLITSTATGSSVRQSDTNEFLSFESRLTNLNQGKSVTALIKQGKSVTALIKHLII